MVKPKVVYATFEVPLSQRGVGVKGVKDFNAPKLQESQEVQEKQEQQEIPVIPITLVTLIKFSCSQFCEHVTSLFEKGEF